MLTVSPFLTYPVLHVMMPLIYNAHLLTLARLYIPAERPVRVTVLDLYVLSSLASVMLVKLKLSGV